MSVRKSAASTAFLVSAILCSAAEQEPASRFYQVIRNDDLSGLRALVQTADVNARDKRGSSPLMFSAAFGSLESMKVLLAAGADVNAKNAFDATALMWGIGDRDKVRLLLSAGTR